MLNRINPETESVTSGMRPWQRLSLLLLLVLFFSSLAWLVLKTVPAPSHLLPKTVDPRLVSKYHHDPELAYVCLCANLRAVYPTLVLFEQLRAVGGFRGAHVALVSTEVSEDYVNLMGRLNITVVRYAPHRLFKPAYNLNSQSTWDRDRILWQKLRVWQLENYRKIVMLDYDLLLMQNFDELFDYEEEIAGVPMLHQGEKVAFWEAPKPEDPVEAVWEGLEKIADAKPGWTGLNSGVLLLRPSQETFSGLVDAASKLTERPCCPSQEHIFRYFEVRGQYRRLPPIYNLRKMHLFGAAEREEYRRTGKIYHFVERRKPVVMGRRQAQGDLLASRWWYHADRLDARLKSLAVDLELLRLMHVEAIRSAH